MVPVNSSVSFIARARCPRLFVPLKSPRPRLAKLFSPAMLVAAAPSPARGLWAMASCADKILSVAIGGVGALGFPGAPRLAPGLPRFPLAAVGPRGLPPHVNVAAGPALAAVRAPR